MYFPIGWPQTLNINGNVHTIVSNQDQTLFLFIANDVLSIWFCRPAVQLVHYKRTSDSLFKYGHHVSAVWKSDSSKIVVQTNKNYLLFYQVIINENDVMPIIDSKNIVINDTILEEIRVPALYLFLKSALKVEDGITCIMAAEEEMIISTKSGLLSGIEWEGQPDDNFRVNISVPPNYYLKKESEHDSHIIDFKYSTIIGGFSLVFSNGLGAFLPLNEHIFTHTQLQLISHVDNALCTAINHKYAFIIFGLISSEAVACDYDDVDRRFVISYKLSLPSNVNLDAEKILGPLTSLQWTPDSTVLATIWENGDFALWSVFGSLLSYSHSWHNSLDIDSNLNSESFKVGSLAFGKEGFHLWMVTSSDNQSDDQCKNRACKLSLVKSVLAANPCSSVNLETILLCSEDRIFVGGNKNSSSIAQNKFDDNDKTAQNELLKSAKLSNVILSEQESNAVDSFQWITIPIPQNYLSANWPIRYFAIDPLTSQNIAVAGLNGFAMYSLIHRRWKLFGNENHEKDVTVTGGLLWYYDYLLAGCYNLSNNCFEIRAYSRRNKLDNANGKIILIEHEVQLLSLYQNRLLAFCNNGSMFLFDLHLFKRNNLLENEFDINISAPIRVVINSSDLLIPDCVTSCLLTNLHVDMYHSSLLYQSETRNRHSCKNFFAARSHSILINMCGRVLLLEMDIDTSKLPFSSDEDEDYDYVAEENFDGDNEAFKKEKNIASKVKNSNNDTNGPSLIKYKRVVKLASNVENLWMLPHDDVQLNSFRSTSNRNSYQLRPHLETSLYLSCGGHGMAIWLSLEHSIRYKYDNKNYLPNNFEANEHTYISKRIMLPLSEIGSTIYPLAIKFRDAVVLGAESDFTQPNLSFLSQKNSQFFSLIPYFVVKRTSQVYLHYILRELLRRNLGYRAWEIANTCSTLPHFVHSLELLLHGVLEEEASSSHPIPDALLPRVVEFIRAFPVFLQTVIHCARKTELALWPHLFNIVGSPKDLFHQCLSQGQLDTASSYIIVLQNLEKPEVAAKCASRLLQAARVAGCWVTVKELKRFLRAINEDNESMKETDGTNDIQRSTSNIEVKSENDSITPTPSQSPNPIFGQSIINNGTEANKILHVPGAAIKSIYSDNISEKCFAIENVIMNETVEHLNNNHKNNDIDIHKDQEESLKNNDYSKNNGGIEKQRATVNNCCNGMVKNNSRAYPGTILRMTQDDNINKTLKFLTISENYLTSSISSSSTSLSSAPQQENHSQQKIIPSSNCTTNKSEELKHLRTISLENDREQCIIS